MIGAMVMRLSGLAAPAALAALAALAMGDRAGAATTVARPTADLYVSALHPQRNYGTAPRLLIARRPASRAFVRFQVRPPARGSRIVLYVFPLSASPRGMTLRHASSRPWAERRITWRTAPVTGPREVHSGPLQAQRWKAIDVSRLVDSSGVVTLALSAAGSGRVARASREASARAPRLVVFDSATAPVPASPPAPTAGASPGDDGGAPPRPPAPGTCGSAVAPPAWQHVVWIVLENKDYGQIIGSPDAPYINALAAACGLATQYHAVAHPSLPNYIALTSGDTQGVTKDVGPASQPLDAPSIFSQLGNDWRSLQESIPAACSPHDATRYAPRHNPALDFAGLLAACPDNDVPPGATPALSARFTQVTPDTCNDMHSCAVAVGDRWLSGFMAKVIASPEYQAGTTAVFVTWDEDDRGDNHVATLVVSPSTPPGTADAVAYNHYSLLRTTEEMLGLPLLGQAAVAGSMRPG